MEQNPVATIREAGGEAGDLKVRVERDQRPRLQRVQLHHGRRIDLDRGQVRVQRAGGVH